MPRYRYRCEGCKKEQLIFHLIKEVMTECPLCHGQNQLKKILTTPNIVTDNGSEPEEEVGEITKEYIEANREILKQQKAQAKKENYDPS
jgi:putative FmdB family regulatory protein|tara:strand:+ start:105 stop:371 length:267 start_codon:yes stop_codon:yes gene_type:complete